MTVRNKSKRFRRTRAVARKLNPFSAFKKLIEKRREKICAKEEAVRNLFRQAAREEVAIKNGTFYDLSDDQLREGFRRLCGITGSLEGRSAVSESILNGMVARYRTRQERRRIKRPHRSC